ncbi:MAG: FeoA domain-containing protein [Verrucomicrobia bacterium]|nr:FeoA domain-containing protein [Verrucomicrobiota bacterium]
MQVGAAGAVETIDLMRDDSLRVREIGFLPGAMVRVIRRAPLGDPIEVEIGGAHLALRRADAALISVRITADA